MIEVKALWHKLTNTTEAELTFFGLVSPANITEIGFISARVPLSLEESYLFCGANDMPLQRPSAPAFHLHGNRDARTNRQQAPNLPLCPEGQDETREMACSWYQRANSSGPAVRARKFPVRKDVGSA